MLIVCEPLCVGFAHEKFNSAFLYGISLAYTEEEIFYYDIENGPIWVLLKSTTMLLTVIFIVESALVLLIRRINLPLHKSLREPGTWIFVIFIGLIFLAHNLLMYNLWVNETLATLGLHFFIIPLTALDWIICILLSLPAIIGVELYKRRFRKRDIDL